MRVGYLGGRPEPGGLTLFFGVAFSYGCVISSTFLLFGNRIVEDRVVCTFSTCQQRSKAKGMVLDPWTAGVDLRREEEFRLAGVRCYACLGPAAGE